MFAWHNCNQQVTVIQEAGGMDYAICLAPEAFSTSIYHEFHETYILFHEKRLQSPNNAVTPQRQSQFTPKMKANAVPRLLSSLV